MRVDVSRLLKEPIGSEITVQVEEGKRRLAEDLEVEYLRGSVKLIHVREGLYGQGEIETQVMVECARCLKPTAVTLTVSLDDYFYMKEQPAGSQVFPIGADGRLNLDIPLRELILVALPMRPLCRPDCRGLCPHCGHDLNEGPCGCSVAEVDPRLAVLSLLVSE